MKKEKVLLSKPEAQYVIESLQVYNRDREILFGIRRCGYKRFPSGCRELVFLV